MDAIVKIHNDHCKNMGKEDIQAILDQVTALVTSAILRATTQAESSDIAALLLNIWRCGHYGRTFVFTDTSP